MITFALVGLIIMVSGLVFLFFTLKTEPQGGLSRKSETALRAELGKLRQDVDRISKGGDRATAMANEGITLVKEDLREIREEITAKIDALDRDKSAEAAQSMESLDSRLNKITSLINSVSERLEAHRADFEKMGSLIASEKAAHKAYTDAAKKDLEQLIESGKAGPVNASAKEAKELGGMKRAMENITIELESAKDDQTTLNNITKQEISSIKTMLNDRYEELKDMQDRLTAIAAALNNTQQKQDNSADKGNSIIESIDSELSEIENEIAAQQVVGDGPEKETP